MAGAVSLMLILSACAGVNNNDRSLPELVNHIATRVGGTFSGKVFVPPVKALDGVAMRIEGRDVFFYQYDINRVKQSKKLAQIRKYKKVYINGIPFVAEINGSFVMIGHDTNIKKKELISAFRSF